MREEIRKRCESVLAVLDRPKAIKEITREVLRKSGIDPKKLNYDDFMNELGKARYVIKLLLADGKIKFAVVDCSNSPFEKKKVYMKK